jgi:hypothetical protein
MTPQEVGAWCFFMMFSHVIPLPAGFLQLVISVRLIQALPYAMKLNTELITTLFI